MKDEIIRAIQDIVDLLSLCNSTKGADWFKDKIKLINHAKNNNI